MRQVFTILLAALTCHVFGQDPVQPRADLIPHSPEVEAMVKHGVLPMTFYTGTPQISIPIYEIKASGLTIPFSLSYNYNGYKPIENASWCGLGWSLQGTGSISRIVKGLPDDYLNVGNRFEDFVNPSAMSWSQPLATGIANSSYDMQPDVYVFNVGGYSGKFILIKGQAYLFPYQNLKITQSGTGFRMIDDKGNTYLFNDTETTFTKNAVIPNHISAWHISQIITADKTDTVSYSYYSYSYKQPSAVSDSYSIDSRLDLGNSNAGQTFARTYLDGDHITALAPLYVKSRYGSISFVGITPRQDLIGTVSAMQLDSIIVKKPNGSARKKMVLLHDYFSVNKLRLKETYEVQSGGTGQTISEHYLFAYQDASGCQSQSSDVSAVDTWGYYNGYYNAMLFPNGVFGAYPAQPYGNRSANSACSSYGIIKQITYPTKGYSTFTFEQNQQGSYSISSNFTPSSLTTDVAYDPNNQTNGATEIFKSFNINKAQMVHFIYGDADDNHIPTKPVVKIYKNATNTPPIFSSIVYQDQTYNHYDSTFLIEGNYYFSVTCENGIVGTDLPYGTFGTMNYKTYQVNNTLADGPGLRLKTISSYDNVNTVTPALTKQYYYNNGVLMTSSGMSVSSLHHICSDYYNYSYSASVGSAINDLAENQFYYGQVTEASQDTTKTGKTVYNFVLESQQLLDVKLQSQTEYKYVNRAYLPVKSTVNQYQIISKNGFVGFGATHSATVLPAPAGTMGCTMAPSPDATQPSVLSDIYELSGVYTLVSDHTLLSSTQEILYNDDGTSNVNQSNYYYNNPEHTYPTRIVTAKSNGDSVIQQMLYPLDYHLSKRKYPDAINTKFNNDVALAGANLSANYSNLLIALQPYQPYSIASNDQAFNNITSQYHLQSDFQSAVASATGNRNTAMSLYSSSLDSAITANSISWQKAVAWLQKNNVMSPVIEKYVSVKKSGGSEYLLSATRNEYTIWNNSAAVPTAIKQTEVNSNLLKSTFLASTDNYYKPQLNFSYDKSLKLIGQQKNYDFNTTYLYGYNQQYPVAEVKNASFSQVLAWLGLTEDQYVTESKATTPSLNYLTKLNSLRQANALVTIYAYDPLVGITSMTDPNNKSTYYQYDKFGRLVTITDNNKHILKTFNYYYQQ